MIINIDAFRKLFSDTDENGNLITGLARKELEKESNIIHRADDRLNGFLTESDKIKCNMNHRFHSCSCIFHPSKPSARRRANKKSDEKYWEYRTIKVHKGIQANIKAAADMHNQSINAYITQAINERMERETKSEEAIDNS